MSPPFCCPFTLVQVYLDGVHGDTCATFAVGDVDQEAKDLISVAKTCTAKAIEACGLGKPLSVIPEAIA